MYYKHKKRYGTYFTGMVGPSFRGGARDIWETQSRPAVSDTKEAAYRRDTQGMRKARHAVLAKLGAGEVPDIQTRLLNEGRV